MCDSQHIGVKIQDVIVVEKSVNKLFAVRAEEDWIFKVSQIGNLKTFATRRIAIADAGDAPYEPISPERVGLHRRHVPVTRSDGDGINQVAHDKTTVSVFPITLPQPVLQTIL